MSKEMRAHEYVTYGFEIAKTPVHYSTIDTIPSREGNIVSMIPPRIDDNFQ